MRWKRLLGIAAACMLAISAVTTFDWAPARASRLGQTVPTRTPTVDPSRTLTPTAMATLAPTTTFTATLVPVSTAGAPALLPEAGGAIAPGGLIAMGMALLVGGGGMWLVRRCGLVQR